MISLTLEPIDRLPLEAALPGQFVVLRLKPAPGAPALMRSYSLSGEPSLERHRISVKLEPHGAAGAYIDERLEVGDVLDVSAARGAFTLQPGDGPVVFLSAGIGATPVLAMLHALAAEASPREVWWLHGARNRREHPFAEETRALLKALAHGRSHIRYSLADPDDRQGVDFDAPGRLDMRAVEELGVPRDADFYICGPTAFMSDLTRRPRELGHRRDAHSHRDLRRGTVQHARRRRVCASAASLAGRVSRRGAARLVREERSRGPLGSGVRKPARACRSLRHTGAMVMPDRRLPQLRDRTCGRDGPLPTRAARCTGGWQCADLLRPAGGRRRHRFVMTFGLDERPLAAGDRLYEAAGPSRLAAGASRSRGPVLHERSERRQATGSIDPGGRTAFS